MRAVRPILFVGLRFAFSNDRGLAPRRRAKVRELSPYSSQQSRWRGGAAFWVGVHVSPTTLQPPTSRPRASAMLVPTWGLNCRCTPASAPFGSPSAREYLGRGGVGVGRSVSPTSPLGLPIGGVGSCFAFPNGGFGDFHPRAR